MIFAKPNAEIYVPDGVDNTLAISRTTHMAIAAHQDDIEVMAYDGIVNCYDRQDLWFFGVVVTDGAGSARTGKYRDFTDSDMQAIRKIEQRKAADIGKYGAIAMLDYTSKEVKNAAEEAIIDEIVKLIMAAKPKIIYTHNPTDKHDTHIAVMLRVIEALRRMPSEAKPEKLYGCEVWRSLDWVNDKEKVIFDVSQNPKLALELITVFDSQIAGGKRYDLATLGRRTANATYVNSHSVDDASAVSFGVDLTDLVVYPDLDVEEYAIALIERFREDVTTRIRRFS